MYVPVRGWSGPTEVAIVQVTEHVGHPEEVEPVISGAQVVILYEHALLGEGIAKHVRTQLGVEAMVASGDDFEAATSALACDPAVVIFELSDTHRQLDLTRLAPQTDLIDVSTVLTRGADSSGAAGLKTILRAIRSCDTVDQGQSGRAADIGWES